jgi:PAS domain S-box-containing protein
LSTSKKLFNELKTPSIQSMSFLQDAPVACFVVNEQGDFVFLNQAMENLLALKNTELLHTSIFSRISQDSHLSFKNSFNPTKSSISIPSLTLLTPKGNLSGSLSSKWVNESDQSYLLSYFAPESPVCETGKCSESIKMQAIIKQTSEMLFFHDLEGNILDVNPAVSLQTGYSREELLSMNIYDIDIHADSLRLKKGIWKNKILNQGPIRIDSCHKRKDGSIYPAEININRVFIEDKQYIFGLAHDISERKEIEEIQHILDVSMTDMLNAKSEDAVFSIVAERIQKIIRKGIVVSSILDESEAVYRLGLPYGIDKSWKDLTEFIGFDPQSLSINSKEFTPEELSSCKSGKLCEINEGLYSVFTRRLARESCQKIEQYLGVQHFYGIGFSSKNSHFGNVIIMRSRPLTKHKTSIELIVNQASLVIERLRNEKALRESERRYSSMISHLPGFVYRCSNNQKWTMHYISEGCYPITGYRANEFINDKVLSYNDIIAPEYKQKLWDLWQESLAKKEVFSCEYPIVTKNGERRWLSEKASEVFSETGDLEYLEGFIYDISAQKKAVQDLHFQSSILKQIGDFVTATDLEGNIIFANDIEIKTFGKCKDDLLGKSIEMFGCDPDQGATHEEIIQHTLEHGFWKGEVVNFDKDGNRLVLNCRTWIMYDEIGQASALIGVSSNITDYKRIEQELRQKEELFRATIEQSYDGIVIIDAEHRILEWNKAQSDFFGFSKEDMLGQSLKSFLLQISSDSYTISRLFSEDVGSGLVELTIKDKNGLPAIFEFSTFFIRSSADMMRGFIVRDITTQKGIIQMKERFISMVSHELRTPLVSIQGGIRLLLNPEFENLSEEQTKILNIADRNIIRLSQFVNDVLDFQTISSTHYNLNLTTESMLALADEAIQMLEPLAKKKGLKLVNRLNEEMPLVVMDKDKIILVLTNIISNAIKYSKAGNITIFGRFDEERTLVHVMVRDKGIGIEPEDLKKIFTPFYRSNSALKSESAGTGLGLSISKEIIEKHRGKIWIESAPNQGTTLHFILPVREDLT